MIKIITFIHNIIFGILFLLSSVILFILSKIAYFLAVDKSGKESVSHRFSVFWGTFLINISLLKIKIQGLENIPNGQNVIFTPNHQSYFDTFILLKYLPCPFKFIINRKVFKIPMVGSHIGRAGYFSLETKDRKKTLKTIGEIVDFVNREGSVLIFPEGKLTKDGNVGEFKRGASLIIQRSRKPVIPIAIEGTFSAFPKDAWMIKPGKVTVTFGKPVYFESYYTDVTKESSLKLGNTLRDIVINLKNNGH